MREMIHQNQQMGIRDLFIFSDDIDNLGLCAWPANTTAALRSLNLAVFDFSRRLERLHLCDVIDVLEFLNAALSFSRHQKAWPCLKWVSISSGLICDCSIEVPCSSTTRSHVEKVPAALTRSLDHMPVVQSLSLRLWSHEEDTSFAINLEVNTPFESILELSGFTMSHEYIIVWRDAAKERGGGSFKVVTVSSLPNSDTSRYISRSDIDGCTLGQTTCKSP